MCLGIHIYSNLLLLFWLLLHIKRMSYACIENHFVTPNSYTGRGIQPVINLVMILAERRLKFQLVVMRGIPKLQFGLLFTITPTEGRILAFLCLIKVWVVVYIILFVVSNAAGS